MTNADRGALLGRNEGRWQLLASTAVLPLLALVVGGVQTLGAGSVRGFLGLLGTALLAWLVIGLWVIARRATRLVVYERAVVWTRPLQRERVIALEDIRQVRREGGDTTTAMLLHLRDGSFGRHARSFCRHARSFGRHARSFGRHARSFGRHARSFGRHARSFGRHARSFGRHARSFVALEGFAKASEIASLVQR